MTEHKSAMHEMRLNPQPFEMIKNGSKTIELRLYDEKRRRIKVGDDIRFTDIDSGDSFVAAVVGLHRFDSFEELYSELPLLKCGYTPENVSEARSCDMEKYYSAEEESRYGAVGIELSLTDGPDN